MPYKNLSSFPQECMDFWMALMKNPELHITFSTKKEATHLRHTLYAFRRRLMLEGVPHYDLFKDIELSIVEANGHWDIISRKADWKLQVQAALEKLKETKDG